MDIITIFIVSKYTSVVFYFWLKGLEDLPKLNYL